MDLPPEIWEIIIEFTYDPCNKGWHRNLWKIGLVTKMHHSLVCYLFKKYMKKPTFPKMRTKLFLLEDDIIQYMIKDVPVIKPGFVVRRIAEKSTEYKKMPLEFSFTNWGSNEDFFEKYGAYFSKENNKRFLIARSFTIQNQSSKNKKTSLCSKQIEKSFIIIIPFGPNIDKNASTKLGHEICQGVYIIGNIVGCNMTKYLHQTPKDFPVTRKNISNISIYKILRYVIDRRNPIPDLTDELLTYSTIYVRNGTRPSDLGVADITPQFL